MKSILKTFNAGTISNFTLIGMSSILITACGGADSTDPRAYDKTGPEITMAGDAVVLLDIGAEYADAGATARDVWDGDNLVDQDSETEGVQAVKTEGVADVDTSAVGTYLVTYTSEDASGNVSTATRTIEVADRTPPVITITGGSTVSFNAGESYQEQGATYSDAFDGTTDVAVTEISGGDDVDASTPGTYLVTYSATDATGNVGTATRTVVVLTDFQEEQVVFQNGTVPAVWDNGFRAYDQDANNAPNSYGGCVDTTVCPNIDFGEIQDPERGTVLFAAHADNTKANGVFIESTSGIDLRGAESGVLQFDIKSVSGRSDFTVAIDCGWPCAGGPITLNSIGVDGWETITIPVTDLMTGGLNGLTMEHVSTGIGISAVGQQNSTFYLDNIVWKCEFTCAGTDQEITYTPWEKVDASNGYDAPTSYTGYDLVWSDEFNGTEIDSSKWNLVDAGGGFGNNELQYYRPENASVENGLLVIEAQVQTDDDAPLPNDESYSSAKLVTHDLYEFKHGRVDIRAAVAEGQGMWSAGWMLGANHSPYTAGAAVPGEEYVGWPFSGEVDIFDTIGGFKYGANQEDMIVNNAYWNLDGPNDPNRPYYNVSNFNNNAWGEVRTNNLSTFNSGDTFSNKFHVFSIEWDESGITFLVDNEEQKTLGLAGGTPCHSGTTLSCVGETFDQDFFLILNVAVGGEWPGPPDQTTQFPRGMLVDYVRVYQTPAQQAAQQ